MCTCVCTCAYRDVPSLHVALAAEGTASSNNIEIGCLNAETPRLPYAIEAISRSRGG